MSLFDPRNPRETVADRLLAERVLAATRRQFLGDCMSGVGALALGSLLGAGASPSRAAAASGASGASPFVSPMTARPPHFAPRAKNVIFLHMTGGPSQVDLFDPKPALEKWNGKECPAEFLEGGRKFAFIRGVPKILASPHKFAPAGKSGIEISDLLPEIATIADKATFIRSMRTEQFNHAPAELFLYTGFALPGRPSMGSWITYGLGSENQDLPGFCVLISGPQPSGGAACWGSGFLPSAFQGVRLRSEGDPVLYVSNPPGVTDERRRASIDAINDLNRMNLPLAGDPEIETRIAQYELAFRMQASVPELSDIASESAETLAEYGAEPGATSFANNCLLARRLVERGTRYVQLFHWGWDTHGTGKDTDLLEGLPARCRECDRASAALVRDLERRGLLDETLVIWGGEFGRTPMNEERNGSKFIGRDHHPDCFTIWMAGGGVKAGAVVGSTDELGWKVAEDPVHVHDLQATILHLLGMDHERLTYKFQGRDFRLTDVHGSVVAKVLA